MELTPLPALLTPEQAAEYLGSTAKTLERWRVTRAYSLPYVKLGRLVRYRRADLDAWIASRVVEA